MSYRKFVFREGVYKNLGSILNKRYKNVKDIDKDVLLSEHIDVIYNDIMERKDLTDSVEEDIYQGREKKFLDEMYQTLRVIHMGNIGLFPYILKIPMKNNNFKVHLLRIYDDMEELLSAV